MPARRGLSVCLIDRARFPSDTPSTHIIQPYGVEMLARFGVVDTVLAAGAAQVDRVTLVNDDIRIDTAGEEVTQEYSAL
jgi:menaquinone-9 beta-reductase